MPAGCDHEHEVKTTIQNDGSMNHENFYITLQCRSCGAAEVRHVETTGEFYAGWD